MFSRILLSGLFLRQQTLCGSVHNHLVLKVVSESKTVKYVHTQSIETFSYHQISLQIISNVLYRAGSRTYGALHRITDTIKPR